MTSQPEEEEEEAGAGPSGLAHHEVLAMLGLETSDSEKEDTNLLCPEEMGDNEEYDDLYNDLLDHLERQHAFQTKWSRRFGYLDRNHLSPSTTWGRRFG